MKDFTLKYQNLQGIEAYDELKSNLDKLEREIASNNKTATYNYNLLTQFRNIYYNGFLEKAHFEIHKYVYIIIIIIIFSDLKEPFNYKCFENCSLTTNNPSVYKKCLNIKVFYSSYYYYLEIY